MDAKEALEILKNERYSTKFFPAIMIAFEALEKQIPRNPIDAERWWECPACEEILENEESYCPKCGQHITWEWEE